MQAYIGYFAITGHYIVGPVMANIGKCYGYFAINGPLSGR
jgi:hypothetical protein